jgi:uncharacterized protein (UPF0305 family)
LDKKFKSIVDELNDYVPYRNREHFLETRARDLVAGFANLTKLIQETYDDETADDLCKRLFNAARSGDERKIIRKLVEMRKGKSDEKPGL